MSEHIEFFAARDDAAAARVRARGPGRSVATVSGTGFAADDAVVTWENLLTGRTGPVTATPAEPRMVAELVNDGSAVFALSAELVRVLAGADPPRLRPVAEAWSAGELAEGNELSSVAAYGVLDGVARLARESARAGHRVYCWISR